MGLKFYTPNQNLSGNCVCVCEMLRFVTSTVTLISQSWLKKFTKFFFPLTHVVRNSILEPLWVPDLHLRSHERPLKSGRVPDGWPDLFFQFDVFRSVIYQIVCILWDKFNWLFKITYGCHPWGQERPSWIRKVPDNLLLGTFLIQYFC